MLGLLSHRETVLPLICLATFPQQPAPDLGHAYVLIVSAGPTRMGLIVQSLEAIERSTWEGPPEDTATTSMDPARLLGSATLIRTAPIGTASGERMVTRLDLEAVARHLAGEAA